MADLHDPALRLPGEISCYLDGLHLAAERTTDPEVADRLERLAEDLLPGLPDAPAWAALRSHLLLLGAADGTDPGQRLRLAVAVGPFDDAHDPAAVLHYRAATSDQPGHEGPVPWLPHLPQSLRDHPTWGAYLAARSDLVTRLAQQVHHEAATNRPAWAQQLHPQTDRDVIGQVAVWRAARQVNPTRC